MNVQLLLLVALVGPFCAFTRASPTVIPTELDVGTAASSVAEHVPDVTEASKEDLTLVTGPPPTDPAAAPGEVATDAGTEALPATVPISTEKPVIETEAPATPAPAAPELVITDGPPLDTPPPTEAAMPDGQPATTAAEAEEKREVIVEDDDPQVDLSSGQVVGIVIGSLLAVVIVIAVVIAVVRRMGKYSP